LLAQAGNGDQALEIWRGALAKGGIHPALRALVQVRIAQVEESAGNWAEAAKSYQEAGEQREYPLWPWALADAARALYEAGDRDQAVRLAQRLRADAPGTELPPHLSGLMDELLATGVPPKG
jgi:tetratricopeptide (TPR) repeat protein